MNNIKGIAFAFAAVMIIGLPALAQDKRISQHYQAMSKAYAQKNGAAAKFHAQSLMRLSRNEDEFRLFQRDYSNILKHYPWRFFGNLSVEPTENLRKNASARYFDTPLGRFLIEDGGEELFGIGFRLQATAKHEFVLSYRSTLQTNFTIERLHMPEDSLSYWQPQLSFQLNNQDFKKLSSYRISFSNRITDTDTQNLNRASLSYSTSWSTRTHVRYSFNAALESHDWNDSDALDGTIGTLTVQQDKTLNKKIRSVRLFSTKVANLKSNHNSYASVLLSQKWQRVVGNARIGLGITLERRRYAGNFPALAVPRRDFSPKVDISFQSFDKKHTLFGTRPKLNCTLHENRSNVALYTNRSVGCSLGFQRLF